MPSALGAQCLCVDANAHTHGGGHGQFAQVNTFAGGRLGFAQCIHQCDQVALQLVAVKGTATNGGVNNTGLVDSELHLTRFGIAHSRGDEGEKID